MGLRSLQELEDLRAQVAQVPPATANAAKAADSLRSGWVLFSGVFLEEWCFVFFFGWLFGFFGFWFLVFDFGFCTFWFSVGLFSLERGLQLGSLPVKTIEKPLESTQRRKP